MSDCITAFFDAWAMSEGHARHAAIADAYAPDGQYADPRSAGTLTGIEAISNYVSAFSANAPGWSARVVKSDATADTMRVTVAFGGTGPDGTEMVQHGQYFARLSDGKITEMTGFVGTGDPE